MGKDEKTDIELVHQARRGAGDDVEVMVDAGQVWDWKTALRRAEQFADAGRTLTDLAIRLYVATGIDAAVLLAHEARKEFQKGEVKSMYNQSHQSLRYYFLTF